MIPHDLTSYLVYVVRAGHHSSYRGRDQHPETEVIRLRARGSTLLPHHSRKESQTNPKNGRVMEPDKAPRRPCPLGPPSAS